MDVSKDKEFIINLKLLKLCRYFGLINPNGKKIFGYNIDRLIFTIILCIIHSIMVCANLGFVVNVDYKISIDELFLILFEDLINFLTLFKTCFLLYRVDNIVELLDVTHIDFLTSKLCRKNKKILYDYRDMIIKYSNSYMIVSVVIVIQWILFAYLRHVFFEVKNADERFTNILNMPYPIKKHKLNKYYALIFVIESVVTIVALYCTVMVDTFLLSYGWIITSQYEILGLAFKDLRHKKYHLTGNVNGQTDINNIKTILSDQLILSRKLESYLELSRPIVLALGVNSIVIIILSVSIAVIFSSSELFSIPYLLKVVSADLFWGFQLYLYCKLFESMNNKKDSNNFAIYSCDWTNMDLKAEKLLLLTMQINDGNRLQMKASPQKIINLQLFASVITTSYNIISVMVNTLNKEK